MILYVVWRDVLVRIFEVFQFSPQQKVRQKMRIFSSCFFFVKYVSTTMLAVNAYNFHET